MRIMAVITLTLTAAVTMAGPTKGAEPMRDIQGKWVGRTQTIVAGSSAHWPTSKGTYEQPGLYEKDLVIEITGQSDRRFWGTTTISGNGEKTQEPFIGELFGKDNREVLMADTDGYLKGAIDGDTLSFCYSQAGGAAKVTVVSCSEVKRAPK